MSIKPFQQDVSYEQYCMALAYIGNPAEVAFALPGPLLKWIEEAKGVLTEMAATAGMKLTELLVAFQNRDMFAMMKVLGWSLKKLVVAIDKFLALIPGGLLKAMHALEETGLLQKLRDGTAKIDEVLDRYPIIKKLAGPALAGLLLWMWMNASFLGNMKFDMDLTMVLQALTGKFTITDLFLSESGLALLSVFALGTFTGIGVAWLGSSIYNLLLALGYTFANKFKPQVAKKLKPLIEKKAYTT